MKPVPYASAAGAYGVPLTFLLIHMEVQKLANIKSAKKRILVTRTKTMRNKSIKSGVKTAVKKVYLAIAEGDKEAAQAALLGATSKIDRAVTKGVFHKNTASRKVSRLAKSVNDMA